MATSFSFTQHTTQFQTFSGLSPLKSLSNAGQRQPAGHVAFPSTSVSRPSPVVAEKKVVKKKQIILTTSVPNVGKAGDLISVRLGFFRNYLFPKGLAKTATPATLQAIKNEQEKAEREKQAILDGARKIARQFQTIGSLIVRRKGGAGKSFFGSVTKNDLIDIIKANTGREVSKDDLELPEIKEVGEHMVRVKLHPEVIADVRVTVVGK